MNENDAVSSVAGRLPVVTRQNTVRDAVGILREAGMRWIIVAEADGIPRAALSGTDLLRAIVPEYVLEDPALARVYSRDGSREVLGAAFDRSVGEILDGMDEEHWRLPSVSESGAAIATAVTFLTTGSTVAYLEGTGPEDPRFITLPGLFEFLLDALGD